MKVKLSKRANKRRKASYTQKIIIKSGGNVSVGNINNGEVNYVEVSFYIFFISNK